MNYITLTVFLLYFGVLFLIGYMAYRKTKNFSDYILGGRELGPFVGGISTGASDMSGWLLLGLPGAIYAGGLSGSWLAIGLAIGAYINWQFVGKRIRVFTQVANNSLTLPDFLENRFRDKTKTLRIISSLFILIFFTFYISSGLVGGAILFEQTFGIPYDLSLWVGAGIIFFYTVLGGFFAVAWTDFLQGTLMFLALLIVPIVSFNHLGGWNETVALVESISFESLDIFTGTSTLGIISLLAWGLGYFGQPHVIVRFMSMRSSRDIVIGRSIYNIWNVLALFGAIFTGFVGIAYFAKSPLSNPEIVFIEFAQVLFNPWVAGFLLVAVLSAIMSTISSQLLISATVLSEDLHKGFFRKNASQKELIWLTRISIFIISIIALVLAFNPDSSVLSLVGYAWAGFGSVFGPVILLTLFWKGTTRNGALAGMVVGGLTVVIWSILSTPPIGLDGIRMDQSHALIPFYLYELVPGFLFSLIATFIFSKIGTSPSREMINEFNLVKASNI
ncbi:sodium/proline symporter PutP [Schinkia azotoformans]|uniref:sodium/proline symporter PutP n=1 Tax=Schinkia azotoformans TaxID=1454 RepID=UPI002DB7CD70|nr:sodium/proline symporter PutP [Schinkia azotoformans]MEC1715144.1 sodium/proline symporter PutP [Schinkia azotoformans]MEC1739806.1 sodium/proline symporter PutP [Schinkia azotoformans]MEC1745569.1 sodium/proline symporter PutP [Schinkia azotoformans]MEC1760048.1 sodium/proline symporter PutP [Schinkia azotoformans]MEC1765069.1 sodium/proline symporter PutP [Schinkia azotoformans]